MKRMLDGIRSSYHGKSVVEAFFTELTLEQRKTIKLVSADDARWISDCIKTYCPYAKRCVGFIRVVTWVMDALDTVRCDAWRDAKNKTANASIPKRGRPAKDVAEEWHVSNGHQRRCMSTSKVYLPYGNIGIFRLS